MSDSKMTVKDAQAVLERWVDVKYYGDEYNRSLMMLSHDMYRRSYPLNVFILNRGAIKIQHAFFGLRAGVRRIIPSKRPVKENTRNMSKSFISTNRGNMS